jgi:diguanylate cyclase
MYYSILSSEITRARRHGRSVSVLIVDVDHFKRVNDNYGHIVGDQVLQKLAVLLKATVRAENSVCRYGGEEFAIIVPEHPAESAREIAERLREVVEQATFASDKNHDLKITISIGVAAFPEMANSAEALTNAADTALYAAKEGGRNRVAVREVRRNAP